MLWTLMSLWAPLSSLLSVTEKKGEVLLCKALRNRALWGAKSEEMLAMRKVKVKYGVHLHPQDLGNDSPNGTTDALENP